MRTLLNTKKLERLILYTHLSNHICGSIVEVGVYKGGSAEAIAKTKINDKKLFLFDTFEGMPQECEHDNYHKKGDFSDTSLESVVQGLGRFKNVFVHRGLFPQETGGFLGRETFSMVHIDVDIYKSYMDCLNFLWPRIVKGGIIIFDDYNEKTCLGAKLAVDEFFAAKKEPLIWPCFAQICAVKSTDATLPIKL